MMQPNKHSSYRPIEGADFAFMNSKTGQAYQFDKTNNKVYSWEGEFLGFLGWEEVTEGWRLVIKKEED